MAEAAVSPLVSTEWLAAHLNHSYVRVVDMRWYLRGKQGREEYEKGHIPGALYMDLDLELASPPSPAEGRHPLPTPDQFQAAARRAGICTGMQVVVYDDAGGAIAARLWWLLHYFGHPKVSVLDGGITQWVAEGRPLAVGQEEAPPAGNFVVRVQPDMIAEMVEVATRCCDHDFILLDAREAARYRGETEPIDKRAGHIPGACNAPYANNLRDGRFKPPAELHAQYAALGADEAGTIVVYCGSGVTAAHDILALTLAGYNARLYPGSWSQWSSQPELPIATGET